MSRFGSGWPISFALKPCRARHASNAVSKHLAMTVSVPVRRLLFWAAAIFALVMAVLPHPPELPGDPSDKLQHVAAFATLGLLGAWGPCAGCPADINHDGVVGITDFLTLLANWGPACP